MIVVSIIVHELLHKIVPVSKFFDSINDLENRKFFSQNIASIYPDTLANFFEEVLVYIATNVEMFGDDPKTTLERYEQTEKKNGGLHPHRITLWKAINSLHSEIKNILNAERCDIQQFNKLVESMKAWVKDNQ